MFDCSFRVPTHEENCFESVLFSKCDGNCTGKFHSDGNTLTETSFVNRAIRWDPTSGRARVGGRCNGASRSGIGEVISHFNCCGQASEVGRTSIASRRETSRSVTMHANYLSLDRPHLSFAAGSLARGMKSPTAKDLSKIPNVLDATCGSDQLERSFLNHKHCLEFWRCSATQTTLETRERGNPFLESRSCGCHT